MLMLLDATRKDRRGCLSIVPRCAEVHMEFNEHFPLHDQPELSAAQLRQAMAERAMRMLRSGTQPCVT